MNQARIKLIFKIFKRLTRCHIYTQNLFVLLVASIFIFIFLFIFNFEREVLPQKCGSSTKKHKKDYSFQAESLKAFSYIGTWSKQGKGSPAPATKDWHADTIPISTNLWTVHCRSNRESLPANW